MRSCRIVFVGGGTGGHVYPGVAVLESLPQRLRGQVLWIGARNGVEHAIVADAGVRSIEISAGKLRRYIDVQNIVDILRVLRGIAQAYFILRRTRPALVFSKGGFVAVPVVAAAWMLQIPVLIHESDADPGLATRLTAPLATTMYLAYEETLRRFPVRQRVAAEVVGNPVRKAFFQVQERPDWREFGLVVTDADRIVLVTGGSLGAQQLNRIVLESVERLVRHAIVIHQHGEHGTKDAQRIRDRLEGTSHSGRYIGRPRFGPEFAQLLQASDVVLSRAGAGALWEIAVSRTPAVLVPLPMSASRGDQIRNARRFAAFTSAPVFATEHVAADAVCDQLIGLLTDRDARQRQKVGMARFAPGSAAEHIATEITRRASLDLSDSLADG